MSETIVLVRVHAFFVQYIQVWCCVYTGIKYLYSYPASICSISLYGLIPLFFRCVHILVEFHVDNTFFLWFVLSFMIDKVYKTSLNRLTVHDLIISHAIKQQTSIWIYDMSLMCAWNTFATEKNQLFFHNPNCSMDLYSGPMYAQDYRFLVPFYTISNKVW